MISPFVCIMRCMLYGKRMLLKLLLHDLYEGLLCYEGLWTFCQAR